MSTTHHATDIITTTTTPGDDQAIVHLDAEGIDTTIELLEAAGLGPQLVCDGSCGGVSGCTVAPIGDDAIAA